MHDSDKGHVSTCANPPFSSSIKLSFCVKKIKKVHKKLFAIEAICTQGSPKRIKPNEGCLIFVRNVEDQYVISQALDSPKLDSKWTLFPDNQNVIILVNTSKTLERNRKGVKLVECQQVVHVFCGDEADETLIVKEVDNYNSDTASEHTKMGNTIHDKKERHCIFARWLVDTYGIDTLSSGSGVLDVAGGNGDLSHALAKFGVPSVLLDPNPRCVIDVPFAVVAEALHADGKDLTDRNDKVGDLVSQCSLIAGMHPDQATEPIVDMALQLGVPFAVLPCCVMPALFPHRKQKRSNDPVRSYSAFCQYLLDKAPKSETFQVAYLPFSGRNKVIFRKNG